MKIYTILKKYPELKDVLFQISPKFVKLNNPIMLKTMGKIASVEDAAKIAGIPVQDILIRLNKAVNSELDLDQVQINPIDGVEEGKKKSTEQTTNPEWVILKESFQKVDVREVEDPFPIIMKLAKDTPINEGFCIIQKFDPVPLYNALEKKGYEHTTIEQTKDEYHAYFYRIK